MPIDFWEPFSLKEDITLPLRILKSIHKAPVPTYSLD